MSFFSLNTLCVEFLIPFVDWLKKSSKPIVGFTTSPETPFTVPVRMPTAPFFFTSAMGVDTTPFTPLHSESPIALVPDFRPNRQQQKQPPLLPKDSSAFRLKRMDRSSWYCSSSTSDDKPEATPRVN